MAATAVALTRGRWPQPRVRPLERLGVRCHRGSCLPRGPAAPTPRPASGSSRPPGTRAFVTRTDGRSPLEGAGTAQGQRGWREGGGWGPGTPLSDPFPGQPHPHRPESRALGAPRAGLAGPPWSLASPCLCLSVSRGTASTRMKGTRFLLLC